MGVGGGRGFQDNVHWTLFLNMNKRATLKLESEEVHFF